MKINLSLPQAGTFSPSKFPPGTFFMYGLKLHVVTTWDANIMYCLGFDDTRGAYVTTFTFGASYNDSVFIIPHEKIVISVEK